MQIDFVVKPDETGKGRVIVDGRFYGLPLAAVLDYKRLRDAETVRADPVAKTGYTKTGYTTKGIEMDIERITEVCYRVNRAYCELIGETRPDEWTEATAGAKARMSAWVALHIANPDAGPEAMHESWLMRKQQEGWRYGPRKDAANKTHPHYIPYNELSRHRLNRDYLLLTVVQAMSGKNDVVPAARGEGSGGHTSL